MNKKHFLVGFLTITLVSATAFYAQQMYEGRVSVISKTVANNLFNIFSPKPDADAASSEEDLVPISEAKPQCNFTEPEERQFEGEYLGMTLPHDIDSETSFKVIASFRNTGNTPWFSLDSKCKGPVISLGTDKPRDRASSFFIDETQLDSGWQSPNRIKMTTQRVDPGEIAYFEFWAKSPEKNDIYVEYFTPVVEGFTWIESAKAKLVYRIGGTHAELDSKIPYALASRTLSDFDLAEEKHIYVDVSDQLMYLKIGDETLHTFPVSTGAPATPTPYGTTRIKFKQDVRVGGAWPHYVMPRFMWFRDGGYGIHALPSLRNDGGTFWREARNHIQRRVSHGCVRLLPEDSEVVYAFGDAGTKITIQP